jgi:hypothetical protein
MGALTVCRFVAIIGQCPIELAFARITCDWKAAAVLSLSSPSVVECEYVCYWLVCIQRTFATSASSSGCGCTGVAMDALLLRMCLGQLAQSPSCQHPERQRMRRIPRQTRQPRTSHRSLSDPAPGLSKPWASYFSRAESVTARTNKTLELSPRMSSTVRIPTGRDGCGHCLVPCETGGQLKI